MKNNTAFTLVYTLYLLQLFIVTILYPGSTVLMLALGFELVTDCPLLVNAAFLSLICLVYCIVQISSWNTYKKLIVSKLLIIVMGILTTYVFGATSVFLIQMLIKGKSVRVYSILQIKTVKERSNWSVIIIEYIFFTLRLEFYMLCMSTS